MSTTLTPVATYAGWPVFNTTGLDDYDLPKDSIDFTIDGGILTVECCGDEMTAGEAVEVYAEIDAGDDGIPFIDNIEEMEMAALVKWIVDGMKAEDAPKSWDALRDRIIATREA